MKDPRKPKESDIQHVIIAALHVKGYMVRRINNIGVPLKSGGFRPSPNKGIPDIWFCGHGKHGWVEVKRPGGKVSQAQLDFGRELVKHGGMFILAFSLEDVVKVL